MKKVLATVLGSSILAASMLAASAPAKAATFACSSTSGIADNVTNTSGCQVSDTANQDFLNTNPLTVNSENFFGINNWAFGGKISSDTGYKGTGSGQSGRWDISSVFQNTWDDVMLIFKSGNGTKLVGYMVEDGKTSGEWTSPFEKSAFNFSGNGTKDVSHISVYYKTGAATSTQSVPEPGTILGLMAFGMGGLLVRKNGKNGKTEELTAKVTV
jgi:PEP-CTERM motif